MKTFCIVFLAMFTVASVYAVPFSAQEFKEFHNQIKNSESHETILKYIDSVECKNDKQKKAVAQLYCRVLAHKTPLLPFDDLMSKVKEKISNLKFEKLTPVEELTIIIPWNQNAYDAAVFSYIKSQPIEIQKKLNLTGIYYYRLGHYKEAYDFLIEKPSFIHTAVRIAAENLQDDTKIFEASSAAIKYNLEPAQVSLIIKIMCEKLSVSDKVKPEEVKNLLQKFNRKYVVKLAKDKAKWEPIIVQIQIALKMY